MTVIDADDAKKIAHDVFTSNAVHNEPVRFTAGSVPVFAAGAHVLKLFPADEEVYWDTECRALSAARTQSTLPTPELLASGTHSGVWYVLMSRLEGRPLGEVWTDLDAAERRALVEAVGRGIEALHRVPVELPFPPDWTDWIRARRENCRAQQAERGLSAEWLERIDRFDWPDLTSSRRVFLHTEVMREHVIVAERDGRWTLSGVVDFEPAMVGPPEYELASVGVFLTGGEPGLFGAFLDAAGFPRDEELVRRVMAYALLHRYSRLHWYLERIPPAPGVNDIDALAEQWFGA